MNILRPPINTLWVPNKPGIYAWYFPLIIYDSDSFNSFYQRVNYGINFFRPENPGSMSINRFRSVEFDLKIDAIFPNLESKWDRIKATDSWDDLKNFIFNSSTLIQPIYVGQTINLNQRISQHLGSDNMNKNTFSNRFLEYMKMEKAEQNLGPNKFNNLIGKDGRYQIGFQGTDSINDLFLVYHEFDGLSNVGSEQLSLVEDFLLFLSNPRFSVK